MEKLRTIFRAEHFYINLVQVGGHKWYHTTQKEGNILTLENAKFTDWYAGQPDYQGTETCVETMHEFGHKWNSTNCNRHWKGICELRCDSL